MSDDQTTMLVPVARLYTQSGYSRASVKSGPGTQLVTLINAQAAVGTWRQRAELRQVAHDQAIRERDSLLADVQHVLKTLATVTPDRAYVEAISIYEMLHKTVSRLA